MRPLVPDRKRILIDKDLPSAKQRWGEAHEIGHSILPWHDVVMPGDKKRTLSLACEQQVESEANFAAGRLLFLQEQFTGRLRSNPLIFDR
jgi:Zn-dependent peptidase ImmA (M78 family)